MAKGVKERERERGEKSERTETGEREGGRREGNGVGEETVGEAQPQLSKSWVEKKLSEEGGAGERAQQLEHGLLLLQRALVQGPEPM